MDKEPNYRDAELIDLIPDASRRGQWVESVNLLGVVDVPALMMFKPRTEQLSRSVGGCSRAMRCPSESECCTITCGDTRPGTRPTVTMPETLS